MDGILFLLLFLSNMAVTRTGIKLIKNCAKGYRIAQTMLLVSFNYAIVLINDIVRVETSTHFYKTFMQVR
jgi:hypothetical protein